MKKLVWFVALVFQLVILPLRRERRITAAAFKASSSMRAKARFPVSPSRCATTAPAS